MAFRCRHTFKGFDLYGIDDWLAFTRDNEGVWYVVSLETSPLWALEPTASYASYDGPPDSAIEWVACMHFANGGSRGDVVPADEQDGLDRLFCTPIEERTRE